MGRDPDPGETSEEAMIERPTWKRTLLWILAAKFYGLLILYVLFLRTELNPGEKGFVFLERGQGHAERRREIEASFFERLTPYDGQFYRDIASRGYRRMRAPGSPDGSAPAGNFAFFPLLPAILAAAGAVLPHHHLAATILVSIVLSAVGALVVGLIAGRLGANPGSTVVLLLAFPAAIFQLVLYTEGIFLCLSALALHFGLKRDCGHAALFAFLAGLTRPQGVLLALPLACEFVLPALREAPRRWSRIARGAAAAATPLSGFLALAAISLKITGTPAAFLTVQSSWGRSYAPGSVIEALASIGRYEGPPFDLMGLTFGLALLPFLWRRLPLSLATYGTAAVLLPLATGVLLSFGRFMSVSVPHFLALALLLQGMPLARSVLVTAMVALQILLANGLIGWHLVG
jgi:hypothetical protein